MFFRKILLIGSIVMFGGNFVATSSAVEMETAKMPVPVLVGCDRIHMGELVQTRIIQDFTQDIRYERISGINAGMVKARIAEYIKSISSKCGTPSAIVTASLLKMSFDSFDQSMSGECVLLINQLAGHVLTNIELADYITQTDYAKDPEAICLAAELLYNTGNGSKTEAHKKLRDEIVPIMRDLGLGMYIPEEFE